jgi:hypothetical protein
MLELAKTDNSVIQYDDGNDDKGDDKLDADSDKIIFNVCLVKMRKHFMFLFLLAFLKT